MHQAINNVIDTDVGNSAAVRNPARTGILRQTARDKTQRIGTHTSKAKHYHSKTTYTKNYTYITLYILSILASLVYIGVRIYYIANGVMRQEIPSNTMVVDTSTCANVNDEDCSNEKCGLETTTCENILAGDLLSSAGIGVNDEISADLIASDDFKGIREIMDTHTYSYWWSLIVLAAEIGGFVLVHLSQQMFIRQDTRFYEMSPDRVRQLKQVRPCALHCMLEVLPATTSARQSSRN